MANSTLDIYKASAGSGKTFLLTIQYLKLLLQDPDNYRRILAVTFTNKATAEMKERILGVLGALSRNSDDADAYRQKLLEAFPPLTAATLQQKAREVYAAILHDYSRFSVSTIDAFVQRIVRSFAWEIGIDGGFKLQLAMAPVQEDLAARLYKRLDEDEDLRQWVTDLARERLEGGNRWDFREDMLTLSKELFKEKFHAFETALAVMPEQEIGDAFARLRQKVYQHTRLFETQWQQAGKQVVDLLQQHGLMKEDFHYGNGGFINFFFKAARGEMTEPKGRVLEALDNGATIAAKKAPRSAADAIAQIQDRILRSLAQLVDWYTHGIKDYHTAAAIRKNLGILRLMRVFAEELKHYRAENNALLISDTHLVLRRLTADTPASFIYEKTGNRYHHYLIDEFQDTSGFQWDNFKPLLENAMGEGHYNLLVGDVKQAIYRWRNGDWRLLMRDVQEELRGFSPAQHTLTDNRRSTVPVIEFNNYLFYAAPRLLQEMLTSELALAEPQARAKLQEKGYENIFGEAYANCVQQIPDDASPQGHVRLQWVSLKDEDGEKLDYDEQVLPALHQRITDLLREGYAPADIGILTRSNGEARTIVQFLVGAQESLPPDQRYPILSGDALLLAANPAVQLLISALRVLANGRDTVAMAQLRQLTMWLQGADAQRLEVFASHAGDGLLPAAFALGRHQLLWLPVNELVNQLIIDFDLGAHVHHAPYLLAFQDMVGQWTGQGESGLDMFLQYWEDEGKEASLPAAGNDAVEVITIHKAKGLAYTVVLMPYLDWELKPSAFKAPLVWVSTRNTGFDDIPMVPVRYSSKLAQSDFAYEYFEEQLLSVMDSLNVLYVAFTRARQRIYGWVPFKEKTESSRDKSAGPAGVGDLLMSLATGKAWLEDDDMVDPRSAFDADTLTWSYGQPGTLVQGSKRKSWEWMPPMQYGSWRHRLQLRYRPLQPTGDEAMALPREQGLLLHDALSRLQHPAELDLVLHQMQVDGWISDYDRPKMQRQLAKILALPVMLPWVNHTMVRLAERSLVTSNGDLRRPDLVLYNATDTLVIDFKFTQDTAARTSHLAQVNEYRQVLEQVGFVHVKGVVVYAISGEVITV